MACTANDEKDGKGTSWTGVASKHGYASNTRMLGSSVRLILILMCDLFIRELFQKPACPPVLLRAKFLSS
jgi:hypothetical protein